MVISIASGKGGTGKTTVSTNLALAIGENVQFLDCDVEEPDAHIFLNPVFNERKRVEIPIPEIDQEKCNLCGKCQEICEYNAIAVLKDKVLVFPEICHGCGGCKILCPQNAITEVGRDVGVVEIGNRGGIEFIHGKLNVGEIMSVDVIRNVKHYLNPEETVIIDASPGTSCPVIEAVKGSDYSILVTEPTPFGLSDLKTAVEVMRKLKIPFGVVINRYGLGSLETEDFCDKENIPILMKIPFDKKIASAYSRGIPIIRELPEFKKLFLDLFDKIKSQLTKKIKP